MSEENGFADLHVHSSCSDGLYSVEELMLIATKKGLRAIAITDHDSLAGAVLASQIMSEGKNEVELIPGIELTSEHRGVEVHILGYFIDHTSKDLQEALEEMRQQRLKRLNKIIAKLNEHGIPITIEDVLSCVSGESVGRPHIARALVSKGFATSYIDAFQRYLRNGAPAYVPRKRMPVAEAIRLIHSARGLAVVAHPCDYGGFEILHEVIKLGADGVEVLHPRLSRESSERLMEMAKSLNLLTTGGSDFHGDEAKSAELGNVAVPYLWVERLREYHERFIA
jgi:predicted metal-dependent phosphoesterase TrpH